MSLALKMFLGTIKKQPPFAIGPGTDYVKQRALIDDPKAQIPAPKSVKVEQLELGGVPCELLTPDTDARDLFVSPFFGDYTGFPPMYFFADEGEVLFDDTDLLVPKLKAAGVEVQYEIMKGKFHSFPTLGRSCPESKAYLDDTKAFLCQYLV